MMRGDPSPGGRTSAAASNPWEPLVPVVMARTRFMAQPERFEVDLLSGSIRCGGKTFGMNELQWDTPTRGAVYGVLMNYRGAVEALNTVGAASARPSAPVLFVKPANTWIGYGDVIPIPEDVACVEAGAALGIVMGKTACRVAAVDALNFVAGSSSTMFASHTGI